MQVHLDIGTWVLYYAFGDPSAVCQMLAMAKSASNHFADHRNDASWPSHGPHCPRVVQTIGHRTVSKVALLLAFMGFVVCFLGSGDDSLLFANPVVPKLDDRNSDRVYALISQLDSRDYYQREQAGEALIEIGESAIGPLALKSFACSPEASWRIRRILEQISTQGNETVFYKTTGILQLRYDSSNSEMEKRLSVLEAKWKTQRKKNAISLLRKKGAVIDDPLEGASELADGQLGRAVGFGGPRIIMINGQTVVTSTQNSSSSARKRKFKKRLSSTDAKKEVERILGSDLEQAREIAMGDRLKKPDVQHDQNSLEYQREVIAHRRLFGLPTAANTGNGVSIELDERWQGSASDLKALADVAELTEVKLVKQDLSASYLKQISNIKTIKKLLIENCDFDPKELQNVKWPVTLGEIELAELALSNELLASVKGIDSLYVLTFRECEFKLADGVDELKPMKNLRGLQFEGSDIPTKLFDSFSQMRQLTSINFSYCKFKAKDYKAFTKLHPNLKIKFTAKAFLGVQGPMDLVQSNQSIGGCLVTEVVAGSGAQKGGVKVNDVIEKVNGEKVTVFNDLRLQIAQHRPGEKIDVTVQRRGKSIDLEIELSSFEKAPQR